jgi:hypothetical protein
MGKFCSEITLLKLLGINQKVLIVDKRIVGLISIIILFLVGCGGGIEGGNEERRYAQSSSNYAPSAEDIKNVYRFFIIAFDAAPGLTYLRQIYDAMEGGASLKQIVNTYTTKYQFKDRYPEALDTKSFAIRLVQDVVGEDATDSAKEEAVRDIVYAMDVGKLSRGDVIYTIFSNLAAKSADDATWGRTAKRLDNKIKFAEFYTSVLFKASTDLIELRAVVSYVDSKTEFVGDVGKQVDHRIYLAKNNVTPLVSPAGEWLVSLKDKYSSLCGESAGMQNAIPVDLNRDGKKYLLLNLWCPSPAQPIYAPTKNLLIALIQVSPGVIPPFSTAVRSRLVTQPWPDAASG